MDDDLYIESFCDYLRAEPFQIKKKNIATGILFAFSASNFMEK